MKAATCMVFTLFKPTSYLQYHPQYKKPATIFPAILDGLLPRPTLARLYQVSLTMGGDGAVGGQGYTLNKMNWEVIRVKKSIYGSLMA